MGLKILSTATAVVAAIALSACSSAPQPAPKVETEAKKEAPKAPEAVAAFTPYFEMYKQARAWAPDLLTLTLRSGEVSGVKNEDGKAGMWIAVFVSPGRHEARTFTYAAAESGDLRKGINVSDKQNWAGATPASKAFTNSEFLVNSDAAYKAAYVKAAEWVKAHPTAPVTLALGNSSRFPAPVWYIMWGTPKNGYFAYVNATTGAVVTQ